MVEEDVEKEYSGFEDKEPEDNYEQQLVQNIQKENY